MSIGPKEAALRAQREQRFGKSLPRQIGQAAENAKAALRKLLPPVTNNTGRVTNNIATVSTVKRGRGRPPKANALTPAEKQRAYRERKRGKA